MSSKAAKNIVLALVLTLKLSLNLSFAKPLGPIELQDQFPFALNHAALTPTTAKTIGCGELKLHSSITWSNTFARKREHYRFDLESVVATLNSSYGISDKFELGATLPLIWRGAGVLDKIIDDWHKIWSLPRGGREEENSDEFNISGDLENGETFEIQEQGSALGDLQLWGKYALISQGLFSALVKIGLPTSSESAYGQGEYDLVAGFLSQTQFSIFNIYSGASYSYFSDIRTEELEFNRHHFSSFINFEYPWSDKLEFELGLFYRSGIFDNVEKFPNYALYLDTGLRYHTSQTSWLEFLIRENPGGKRGTPDVSFYFGAGVKI